MDTGPIPVRRLKGPQSRKMVQRQTDELPSQTPVSTQDFCDGENFAVAHRTLSTQRLVASSAKEAIKC